MLHFRSLILLTLTLAGCGTIERIQPISISPSRSTTEHKFDASYEIGRPMQAYVGERMIHVRDYYMTTKQAGLDSGMLVPTDRFTINIPPLMSTTVLPSEIVNVGGKIERDGKSYRVVTLPAAHVSALRFLLNDDGTFEGSAINSLGAKMGWRYTPSPRNVRLIPAQVTTQIDTSKGALNYELLYSGTMRDSFQIVYREYTKEDLVRPAFSQTLIYEKNSASVRFRDLQLEVQEASNEKIRFKVIADGRSQ